LIKKKRRDFYRNRASFSKNARRIKAASACIIFRPS